MSFIKSNIISLSTAGGGKTTRLIKQVKNLMDFLSPNRILIISFTNATCDDIYKRCEVRAQTFHGFCYKFITQKTIEENIAKIVEIHIRKFPNLCKLGIGKVVGLLHSYFLVEDMNEIEDSFEDLNKELMELSRIIRQSHKNRNCIVFSDIIKEFKRNITEYLMEIDKTYDYILVDEAQDLSKEQLEIMTNIITEVFLNKGFFIVGDIKQSIYDFQGSHPMFYVKFLDTIMESSKKSNIPLQIENKNHTYRFGGKILEYINSQFEKHSSDKLEGNFHLMNIQTIEAEEKISKLIEFLLLEYNPEDIMVIYRQNSSLVAKIQHKLSEFGFDLKVYTKNNPIISGLRDILGYIYTKNLWYKVKILQGPFVYLGEPHLYLLKKANKLESYMENFFNLLDRNKKPSEIIEILSERLYCEEIDSVLLNNLYKLSFGFNSFFSFFSNIPEIIKVKKEGIQFSTIHHSKGLQSKVVLYLDLLSNREKLEFCLSKKRICKSTENNITMKNLNYVALTRASEVLYRIQVS